MMFISSYNIFQSVTRCLSRDSSLLSLLAIPVFFFFFRINLNSLWDKERIRSKKCVRHMDEFKILLFYLKKKKEKKENVLIIETHLYYSVFQKKKKRYDTVR